MKKIYIAGEDARSNYLKDMCENLSLDIEKAEVVFLPIPFTKDSIYVNTKEGISIKEYAKKLTDKIVIGGPLPSFIKELFLSNNIKYFDVFESDSLAIKNAIPTAEGAIYLAMEKTNYTIHDANVLVMGFGRCARILSNKLDAIGAKVSVTARKQKDLAEIFALGYNSLDIKNIKEKIANFDIIFSTIPFKILDEDMLKLVKRDVVIIDIASSPGSVDYEVANKLNICAYIELGIPAKVAPYTAAKYLKETIDEFLI